MRADGSYVIGVDAGGTGTRAACVALDGRLLGRALGSGGSPTHNDDARDQVARTVAAAITDGALAPADAVGLCAGMAGLNQPSDQEWARTFFALPDLDCPLDLVNDAVIAHTGAFAGSPGVIVVAGTGSMIMAITATGEQIDSGRYHHYAGGARHLTYDLMARVLTGRSGTKDSAFVAAVLRAWDTTDLIQLRRRVLEVERDPRNVTKRRYGDLAPLVTAHAETAPVAAASVDWLTGATAVGVRLVAPHIDRARVDVAVVGSLADAPAFRNSLERALTQWDSPRCVLVDRRLGPLGGAVLTAIRNHSGRVHSTTIDQLRQLDQPRTPSAATRHV